MLVILSGMSRSGSLATWQIMGQIVRVTGSGRLLTDTVLTTRNLGDLIRSDEIAIAKLFNWNNLLQGQDIRVVVGVRDPRDAVVSLMYYLDEDFDSIVEGAAYRDYATIRETWIREYPDSHMVLRYEDFQAERPAKILELAAFMDVSLGEAQAAEIDEQWKAYFREKVEKQDALPEGKQGRRHIHSGEVGQWQTELTPEQILRIETDHGDWMMANGYERVHN